MNRRGFGAALRDVWRLTIPYFRSEERWSARLLLLGIIVLNFGQVGLTVLLNSWRGAFYNALEAKDVPGFTNLIFFWRQTEEGFMPGFVVICAVLIPAAIYSTYLTQVLQIRWRRWLTARTLGRWLSERAYYTIGLQHEPDSQADPLAEPGAERGADNPDQRISDDLDRFTDTTLSLGLDLLSTIVSLVSFAEILYALSGPITVFGVTIPGYMLFVAILYAVIGTGLTHLVGRPLIGLEFLRQKVEADFRFALVRVRENVEGVALYAGEAAEQAGLLQRFGAIVANWRVLIRRRRRLTALTSSYSQVAAIFPIVVAAPRFFAGQIALGGLMRIAGAFAEVQGALSWFVTSYQSLASWRATVDRLTTFNGALDTAHALAGAGVRVRQGAGGSLGLRDITLVLPDGRVLLDHGALEFPPGRSTVISGRSGSGKSTLFRAMAGIWPFGSGSVERPAGTQLFLPQRPYIPLGTLRHAVTYPAPADTIGDDAVRQALADAGLGALVGELDRDEPWSQRLSGGEQQRLAIARALLLRPDWLFMDEATASLDSEAEAELYAILRRSLPQTTIISIAHRPEVARWHDATLTLKGGQLTPSA